MTYIILLWVLLEQSVCALTVCPRNCKCDHSSINCYGVIPGFIPPLITEVIVYDLPFENWFNFSDPSWINVTHLSIKSAQPIYQNSRTVYRILHENEFLDLKNLEYLQLTCNCLKEIHKSAFRGLDKLKVLNLSNNADMSVGSVAQGLGGDGILPNLTELYLSNTVPVLGIDLHSAKPTYTMMESAKAFVNAVKNKPLKVLDISNSKNAWFSWEYDLHRSLPLLEKLNISNTSITDHAFSNTTINNTFALHKLSSRIFTGKAKMLLKSIDVSYPSWEFPMNLLISRFRLNMFIYHLTPFNLTEVYAKKILDYPVKVYGMSGSEGLCLSFLPKENGGKQVCIEAGVNFLDKLVISENSVTYFEPNIWQGFDVLRYLDVSKNNLGYAFSGEGYAWSILEKLKNLEFFIVSANNITYIPEDTFRSSKTLKVLDLAMNKLEGITFRTDYLHSLIKLDISCNKIIFLDGISLDRLKYLQTLPHLNCSSDDRDAQIDLKGNPFVCSCNNTQFLYWLTTSSETYTCRYMSEDKRIDISFIQSFEYLCKVEIVIVVFSLFSLVCFILVSILTYILIKKKRRFLQRKKTNTGIDMYSARLDKKIPPVFLSFCTEDEDTVMDEIFPNLDAGLKKLLRTDCRCVATDGTDFRPGFSIADEIIRCIEASYVVIFFVTNAFCETLWCKDEAFVAYRENKPIILMLWEKVNTKTMPKHLYKHYKEYARVHWMQEDGQRVMKPGWSELCEAIVRLFTNNAPKK